MDDETLVIIMFEIDELKKSGPSGDTALEELNGKFETHALEIQGCGMFLLFVTNGVVIILLNLYRGADPKEQAYRDACEALGLVGPSRDPIGGQGNV